MDSELWGSMTFEEADVAMFVTDIEKETSLIDDVDDDFLMMVDEPDDTVSLGIESENSYTAELPVLYPLRRKASIHGQSAFSSPAAPVSPDPSSSHEDPVPLPPLTQIQRQYQQTMKKLAKSMRRSDATRAIVKRQRMQSPQLVTPSNSFTSERGSENDFFCSPRCNELEESRKKLLRMIQY